MGLKVENNKTNIKIIVKKINYISFQYENNKWVKNNELKNINYKVSIGVVSIPKKVDVLETILKNTKINDDILKKHYPSYFSAQALYSKKIGLDVNNIDGIPFPNIDGLIVPPMEFLKKVSHRYFGFAQGNHLAININNNNIYADDFNAELRFELIMYDSSFDNPLPVSQTIVKRGVNKNLNNLLQGHTINRVFLKKDGFNNKNTLAYKLASEIKKIYPNVVDNLMDINNMSNHLNLSMFNQLSITPIFSNKNKVFNPNHTLFKDIGHKVFNIPINIIDMKGAGGVFIKESGNVGDIERHSGMFVFKENELFQINQISYDMPLSVNNLKVEKNSSNNYVFSFVFSTLITLNDKLIQQKSTMNLELSIDEWKSLP